MSKSSIIGYTTSNVSSLTDAECCCVSYIHDGLLRRPNGWWLLGLVGSRCLEQLTIVLILLVAPKKSQRRAASTCHQDGSRVSVFCNATKRWREMTAAFILLLTLTLRQLDPRVYQVRGLANKAIVNTLIEGNHRQSDTRVPWLKDLHPCHQSCSLCP